MHEQHHLLKNEAATARMAQAIANCVVAGDVVFLEGDLGAGKTTFTRYFARALGVTGRVKSPTYALLESYDLPVNAAGIHHFHHFDLYRLAEPREWFSAGFDEYLNNESVVFIEWAEKAQGALPTPTLVLRLSHVDEFVGSYELTDTPRQLVLKASDDAAVRFSIKELVL
jgi:tRNA threonylcarbamoyladenosine biosynthesis protein TsaE